MCFSPISQRFYYYLLISLFFYFIGVQPINNLVLISDAQQRDSALHIHVSILPQHSPPIQAEEEAYFPSSHFCAIEIILCGEGNGTPLQYSCLANLMDGEAW